MYICHRKELQYLLVFHYIPCPLHMGYKTYDPHFKHCKRRLENSVFEVMFLQ